MSSDRTPTIYNVTLTDADTEYSQAIGKASEWSMQARTAAAVRFAFVTGKVATPTAPYATMKSNASFEFQSGSEQRSSDETIYLASASAGTVVEIVIWDA